MLYRVIADVGGILFVVMSVQEQFFAAVCIDIVNITHPFAYHEIAVAGELYAVAAIGEIGDGAEVFVRIGEEHGFPGEDIEPVLSGLQAIGAGEVVHVERWDIMLDAIDFARLRIGDIYDSGVIHGNIVEPGGAGDFDLFDDAAFRDVDHGDIADIGGIEAIAVAAKPFGGIEPMYPVVIVGAVETELSNAAFAVNVPATAVDERYEEKGMGGVWEDGFRHGDDGIGFPEFFELMRLCLQKGGCYQQDKNPMYCFHV